MKSQQIHCEIHNYIYCGYIEKSCNENIMKYPWKQCNHSGSKERDQKGNTTQSQWIYWISCSGLVFKVNATAAFTVRRKLYTMYTVRRTRLYTVGWRLSLVNAEASNYWPLGHQLHYGQIHCCRDERPGGRGRGKGAYRVVYRYIGKGACRAVEIYRLIV